MSKYFDLEKLKGMVEAKAKTVLPEHASAFLYIANWFNHLPAADVEPVRHAHWIKREKMDNGLIDEFIECSNCGEEFDYILALSTLGYCEKNREDVFLFCPHCGAKMDGKEQEK